MSTTMLDRYEFTAADGSRRWCSQELLGAERFTETCGHFRISGDYCGTCSALRIRSLSLLKPRPNGLLWVFVRPYWRLYETEIDWDDQCDEHGLEFGHLVANEETWQARINAVYGSHLLLNGPLSACAHALVDAVREKR